MRQGLTVIDIQATGVIMIDHLQDDIEAPVEPERPPGTEAEEALHAVQYGTAAVTPQIVAEHHPAGIAWQNVHQFQKAGAHRNQDLDLYLGLGLGLDPFLLLAALQRGLLVKRSRGPCLCQAARMMGRRAWFLMEMLHLILLPAIKIFFFCIYKYG